MQRKPHPASSVLLRRGEGGESGTSVRLLGEGSFGGEKTAPKELKKQKYSPGSLLREVLPAGSPGSCPAGSGHGGGLLRPAEKLQHPRAHRRAGTQVSHIHIHSGMLKKLLGGFSCRQTLPISY